MLVWLTGLLSGGATYVWRKMFESNLDKLTNFSLDNNIEYVAGLRSDERKRYLSNFNSLLHAFVLTFAGVKMTQIEENVVNQNWWYLNAVLPFSTGYFFYDIALTKPLSTFFWHHLIALNLEFSLWTMINRKDHTEQSAATLMKMLNVTPMLFLTEASTIVLCFCLIYKGFEKKKRPKAKMSTVIKLEGLFLFSFFVFRIVPINLYRKELMEIFWDGNLTLKFVLVCFVLLQKGWFVKMCKIYFKRLWLINKLKAMNKKLKEDKKTN